MVRSHHVVGFLHWRESITVICRQWVEKMASVDLSYSGFLHLLLLCHPISTFPPLPGITASSSQPFLAERASARLQLQGRSPLGWILLPFSSISSTLGPPPTLSPRQTLFVSPPTFWETPSPPFLQLPSNYPRLLLELFYHGV